MKRPALAVLVFSALLGGHALADNGPTNPTAPESGVGATPAEIPMPGGTDPRTQGSDPGRQGGASTDGTDRSQRNAIDGTGAENGAGKGGINGSSGSNSGGSGAGSGQ